MDVFYLCCVSCKDANSNDYFYYCLLCKDYVCKFCNNSNGKVLEFDEIKQEYIKPDGYKCKGCIYNRKLDKLENKILNFNIDDKNKNLIKELIDLLINGL